MFHYWQKDSQHHQRVSLTEETNVLWHLPVKLIKRSIGKGGPCQGTCLKWEGKESTRLDKKLEVKDEGLHFQPEWTWVF